MPARIGLVHVVKAPEMDAAYVQTGDVEHSFLKGLELNSEAHLRSVGRLVIFGKTHDHRVQRRQGVVRRRQGRAHHGCKFFSHGEWVRAECRKTGLGVQVILFVFPAGKFSDRSAARRDLTHEQRRRNHAVEESGASANHNRVTSRDRVGEAGPRIEILQRIVDGSAGPGLALPAEPVVDRQVSGRAPLVLNKQSFVRVTKRAFGLVADRRGDRGSLVHRRAK